MTNKIEKTTEKPRSRSQIIWQQFRKHRLAVWGMRILVVLYTIAVFAGFFSTYDANFYETNPPKGNHPPSRIHWWDPETKSPSRPFVYATKRGIDELTFQPTYLEEPSQGKQYVRFFVRTPEQPYTILKLIKSDIRLLGIDKPGKLFLMGTDNFGRDIWSRIVYGSQVSLTIGILASLVSLVLGLIFGGIAGYYSGRPIAVTSAFAQLRSWAIGQGARKTWLLAVVSVLLWVAVLAGMAWLVVQFWLVAKVGVMHFVVTALALWCAFLIVRGHLLAPLQMDPDDIIMRYVEIQSTIPDLFLLITLSAVIPSEAKAQLFGLTINFGDPLVKFYLITFLLGFIGWGGLARIIRGTVLSVRESDYVAAAQSLGASDGRIIGQHILPATATYIIISLSLAVPGAILGESGLSFLGLGIREPYVSWGLLLQSAQEGGFASFNDRPWVLLPGFFIVLAIVAWNFLGDGLRDAFDPRKRS
jgi:peptide/nickel transport system permease protein